jgi:hypothetical protein
VIHHDGGGDIGVAVTTAAGAGGVEGLKSETNDDDDKFSNVLDG